jgi:hypothetical protein
MSDQAPQSSVHVWHMLIRHGLPGEIADRLEIATEVTGRPHAIRAVTTVQRPKVTPASAQAECDNEVQGILRKLPGADPAIRMTMGRTFTVEWAGICRPV